MDEGSTVGVKIMDISRVVSNDLLVSEDGRQSIADYFVGLPQNQTFIFQRGSSAKDELRLNRFLVDGDAVNTPKADARLAYADIPVFAKSTSGTTPAQQTRAQSAMSQADKVFGRDAYYNKGNRHESYYQERFWGRNYAALFVAQEED